MDNTVSFVELFVFSLDYFNYYFVYSVFVCLCVCVCVCVCGVVYRRPVGFV